MGVNKKGGGVFAGNDAANSIFFYALEKQRMNEMVRTAWAAVSLATAKPFAVDCSDGQMKRGGGRGGEGAAGGGTG